jgi:hypothetical protein
MEHAIRIHSFLKRIIPPAKQVVSTCAVAIVAVVAQEEGIGAIRGPYIIELRCVPESFVRELRYAYRTGRGASAGGLEGFFGRVIHVVWMFGRVDVFSVPA